MGFALRVKTKNGNQIVKNLNSESTIKDLKKCVADVSNIPENRLNLLSGFPPKTLDLTKDNLTLKQTGINSGDTLILEEKNVPEEPAASNEEPRIHVTENQEGCPGILMKHVVPADNSCLFSSIHFVLNGKVDETGKASSWMREIIAEAVLRDPTTYSEAILGKPNQEYCTWIKNDTSWGGAIEISILSQYYGIEIAVVDTINAIINRFGEDQDFAHRVFLMFDGIHYDPLYLESLEGNAIQTIFPKEDERILKDAIVLAQEAKSSRQYTDVDKFTLKCMICNVKLTGQVQAQQHAQSTGHMNFGEV